MGEKQSGDGTGEVPDRDVVTGMVEVSISLRNGVSVSLETTKTSELVKSLADHKAELQKAQDESIRYRHAFAALCAVLDVPSWPLDWARIREQVEARFREKDARSGDAWRLGIEAGQVEAAERLRRAYEGRPDLPGTCVPLESLRLKLLEERVAIEQLRVVAEAARRVNVEYEKDFPMRSVPLLREALAAIDVTPAEVDELSDVESLAISHEATRNHGFDEGTAAERAAIMAMARDCPEPIVNAMMEARARDTAGAHMADQIRRMLLEFAAAIERGDHAQPAATDERGRRP